MKILKEYTEPTTIIMTGQWVKDVEPSLMINDDESSISVTNIGVNTTSNLTTFGHMYILTEFEFNWFVTSDHYTMHCDDDFGDTEKMYIVIKDFIGVIGARGLIEGREEFDKWDVDDYFYHQVEDATLEIMVIGEENYIVKSMNINEVKEFLGSNISSKIIFTEESLSLEEKIKILEERIESQEKEIARLSDAVGWCERNIAG